MEHHGASPGPSGLVAFAVACYTFTGVFSGMVGPESLLLLAAWLTGGFVVQIIVANKELDHGELLGGNVFCFFQGFFMLTGAISSICKWLCVFVFDVAYSTVVEGFGWGRLHHRAHPVEPGVLQERQRHLQHRHHLHRYRAHRRHPERLRHSAGFPQDRCCYLPVHRRFSGPLLRQRRPAEHRFRQDRSASGEAADKEHCICKIIILERWKSIEKQSC